VGNLWAAPAPCWRFRADLTARSMGCPHGSARAGPQGCGLVHISTGRWRPWYKHIGSRHPTADCDGGSCWYAWIGYHWTSLRRGAGLSL